MLGPLGSCIIIKVAREEEKAVERVVLASIAKERPQTRTVVVAGGDRLLENGEKVLAATKAGDQVMLGKYAGVEVEYKGKGYLIAAGRDIMAIVE